MKKFISFFVMICFCLVTTGCYYHGHGHGGHGYNHGYIHKAPMHNRGYRR